MSMGLMKNAVAAEVRKLLTLPAVRATAVLTVMSGAVIAALLANSSAASTLETVAHVVPYLQVGPVILGTLAVTQEYVGPQISTTLRATPNRFRLVVGKTVALFLIQTALAAATIICSWCAVVSFAGTSAFPPSQTEIWSLTGITVYLTSAGMIAHGIALLARTLATSLVASLSLLVLAPPLLLGLTRFAHWLPSEAARAFYMEESTAGSLFPETAAQGGFVLAVWVGAALVGGSVALIRRDG